MAVQPIQITVHSQYGITFQNLLVTQEIASSTLVVLFGGARYSLDAPLFHFTRKMALTKCYDVLKLEYGYNVARVPYIPEDKDKIIHDSIAVVTQCLEKGYDHILFISKSLGTYIAGEVAKTIGYDRIRHIFLTPISISMTHMLASRGIVIFGTDDGFVQQMKQIEACPNLKIHLVQDANHALEVEDYRQSIRILSDVGEWCEQYMESIRCKSEQVLSSCCQ